MPAGGNWVLDVGSQPRGGSAIEWNPLEHVAPNWDPQLATRSATERIWSQPLLAATPRGKLFAPPKSASLWAGASVEEELMQREARAKELRDRIAMLEAAQAAEAAASQGPDAQNYTTMPAQASFPSCRACCCCRRLFLLLLCFFFVFFHFFLFF